MIDDSPAADGGEPTEPAKPRSPYGERPIARARRAKAQELIERLVAEGRVRIADPDDDEVAEWRRVVNYAKRHGLEPAGNASRRSLMAGRGWSCSLRRARTPTRGVSGLMRPGGRFLSPHGWDTCIRWWLRSKTRAGW